MSRKVKEFYERRVEFESGKRGKRYVRGENKKLKTLLRMLRNESCKVVLELGLSLIHISEPTRPY